MVTQNIDLQFFTLGIDNNQKDIQTYFAIDTAEINSISGFILIIST